MIKRYTNLRILYLHSTVTRMRLLTDGGTPLSAIHSNMSLQCRDMLRNTSTCPSSVNQTPPLSHTVHMSHGGCDSVSMFYE